jgi:hypothetical protein
MLVVITLLAIATIRISSSSMLIVGNMQARKFVENIGQQSIEDVMNSIAPFNSPLGAVTLRNNVGGTTSVPIDTPTALTSPAGVTVTVSARTCLFSAPAAGYSAVATIAPEDNLWEFQVSVTDTLTGANALMIQGAKIRQLAGSCT